MSDWKIELEYSDAKSSKFWRARTEGSDFIVNYGRIGSGGQTKTKDMGSPDKAEAELTKVASSKRKKGYEDAAGGGGAEPEAAPSAPAVADKKGKYVAVRAGNKVKVEIETDGASIETEIEETLASPEAASSAYDKIVETLLAAGYKEA